MNDGFRDPQLPVPQRVESLLRELTLAEKVALLHSQQAPGPRLGIGAFHTGQEALHGRAGQGWARRRSSGRPSVWPAAGIRTWSVGWVRRSAPRRADSTTRTRTAVG